MNRVLGGGTTQHALSSVLFAMFLGGCASTIPVPHQPSEGHISVNEETAQVASNDDIPKIVQQKAFLPPPLPQPSEQELERYTVVVNDVPVKELLFALARDASLNIDINSDIDGYVTLNAVEQTLPQILERISRQAGLRYELKSNNLYISPDDPYFRTYNIDYVNISREMEGSISVATQIAQTGTADVTSTGGGSNNGGNNSTTAIKSTSLNRFWSTLANNIGRILGEEVSGAGQDGILGSKSVIMNPETGLVSVKATSTQHLELQNFIDKVLRNAQRQVLIEATIVEVTLNDRFQSGIDWSALVGGNDILQLNQTLLPSATNLTKSFFQATLQSENGTNPDFRATLKLLKTFGDTKVLSSPKLMALNNQTAVLKVVDNLVYFTIEQETTTVANVASQTNITTEIHTVPVGLVMSVTPQINENGAVSMTVRPTISSVNSYASDPNPNLTVPNLVPVISVREMESVLKVNSGQVAVLGGLMKDDYSRNTNGVPGLSDVPGIGNAFKQRDFANTKSELLIFLRPVVIKNASLTGDLKRYQPYLQSNVSNPLPITR